ncbi:Uncharacterized protein Adt_41379 [Abeliophyllum distichum]|uniref:Transposase n=1 Tax=Abeliophyllum distichum TaxID=126358 RepID=A0ABD1PNN1_9LAMI
MQGQNEGLVAEDEMTDVLNDVVRDDSSAATSDLGYDALFDAMHSELYPGVSSFSSLNFLTKLMHLKVVNKWTNKSVDGLLKLLKLAFPKINLVDSHYEAKKLMSKLGLGYESIHVCRNDCALFWKENTDKEICPVCYESRWVQIAGKSSGKNVSHKVLRYFSLTPRLKRLFATTHTARLMRWHNTGRSKDNDDLGHPVDGKAWRAFDKNHPDFACEIRNVRLGLSSDGFNPFGNMSQSYSMWPVVLATYNLPPWLCMKEENLMLTLLIPGPQSPGKDMDVFLRPLVDELKELWTSGIDTRDVSNNNCIFRMRVALLWTVSDFPARSSLSGWSGQGYDACPTCNEETPSTRVIGKTAYVGHRRFLPSTHHWRNDRTFNGQTERRGPPPQLTSADILQQLSRVKIRIPGKHPSYGGVKRKRDKDELNWRKKSIFYELPYWSTNELKHNLDVIHVEKNVCDSLLGTLLGDPHKSKDTDNARRDLMKLKIRHELHLYEDKERLMKPAAEYTFINADRQKFCNFIRNVKFPDGFASNLRKNVAPNESRIIGLKSHDCHILMQRLLPVVCRAFLNKTISSTITELCTFFKKLCARSIKVSDMVDAQQQLILILCKLERIFPPAFFDIMIHLVMHLPEEAILGGPVYMRWMYPFERYLKKLKDYVRNQSKPEGKRSLVVLESDVRAQAEFYVLNNCPEIETFLNEHKDQLQTRGVTNVNQLHRIKFPAWFHTKIYGLHRINADDVSLELLSLASRPNAVVHSYPACIVNGVRFLTYDRDIRRKTQNSGVSIAGTGGEIFYGQLQDILELSYINGFSVVVFRCRWFKCDGKRKVTENNITIIDISREAYKDDQFILASQARQVFYIDDPSRSHNWRVVQEVNHCTTWDTPSMVLTEIDLLHDDSSSNFSLFVDIGNLDHITMQRVDIDAIQLDRPAKRASSSNVSGDEYNFINDKEEDIEDEDDNDEGDNGGEFEASDTETDCPSVEDDDDADRSNDSDYE